MVRERLACVDVHRFHKSYAQFTDTWAAARALENRALDEDSELLTEKEEPEKRVRKGPDRYSPPPCSATVARARKAAPSTSKAKRPQCSTPNLESDSVSSSDERGTPLDNVLSQLNGWF